MLSGDSSSSTVRRYGWRTVDERTPSDSELRIAQAQLVGWLEGLFHGIQATMMTQQMMAQQQVEQMRRALPPGQQPQGPGMNPTGYL